MKRNHFWVSLNFLSLEIWSHNTAISLFHSVGGYHHLSRRLPQSPTRLHASKSKHTKVRRRKGLKTYKVFDFSISLSFRTFWSTKIRNTVNSYMRLAAICYTSSISTVPTYEQHLGDKRACTKFQFDISITLALVFLDPTEHKN